MIKHAIGDKVRVIDEDSFHFGLEGVVSRFDEDLHWNVFVWFKDNTQCNFRHRELEAI
jgi:hypothetical protein